MQVSGVTAAVIVVIAKTACVLVVTVTAIGIRPAGMSFHSQRAAGKQRLRGKPEQQGEGDEKRHTFRFQFQRSSLFLLSCVCLLYE